MNPLGFVTLSPTGRPSNRSAPADASRTVQRCKSASNFDPGLFRTYHIEMI